MFDTPGFHWLEPRELKPHPPSPQHFGYNPSSNVVAAPTTGPHHIPPSYGMQPLFVAPAPVATAAIPFPVVPLPNTTAAWMPEVAPRPAPPWFPGPGTGVFLPPGSGHQLPHQMIQTSHAHAEPNSPKGSPSYVHKGTGMEMANGNASPKSSAAMCNGISNGGRRIVDEQYNGAMKKSANNRVEPSATK